MCIFYYLKIDVADVDPEAIRIALREFVQNLANTERDRDDAISEANQLKRNLNEVIDAHNRTEQRLLQLQKCLTESEEGKKENIGHLAI
jgi:rootletin